MKKEDHELTLAKRIMPKLKKLEMSGKGVIAITQFDIRSK